MDANSQPDRLAMITAEELLRLLYGDDFKGCPVSLESVASVIDMAIKQNSAQDKEILDAYEKVFEALHLLSMPPDPSKVAGPIELQKLLSERLDAIHALATKTVNTAARLKSQRTAGSNQS